MVSETSSKNSLSVQGEDDELVLAMLGGMSEVDGGNGGSVDGGATLRSMQRMRRGWES